MIIFLNPDSNGRGRYERKPNRDPVLTGTFLVKAERKDGEDTHAVLKLVRCPVEATSDSPRIVRDYEIVEESELLPIDSLEWMLDSTKYPDGQYALTTDVWCMTLPVVIDNGSYRNDIPQYVGLAPMEGITGRNDADSGWCWIKWMGQREIRQVKRPVKPATLIQGRPKPEDLVAQRLTYMYSGNDAPWEWRIGKSGNILTHYKHQYHSSGLDGLDTGLNRDGYINEGRISHPAGGFVHPDGSLIVASRAGRIVKIHLDGYVETIAGSYIPSRLPHPINGSSKERFAEFYETVGIELAGGCHDVCGDPDDSDIIYIADTNNHRVLKGRISTKQFTILIGGRGYHQQVSEPRGLDISLDGILAVADYRNLSIAFCDCNSGEILWRFDSVRPSGEHRPDDWDGTTKIPEHFQVTTARIREVARWGEAGNAAFMYPSMCRFDSNGDLIIVHDRQQQVSRLRLSGAPTLEFIADIEPDTSSNTYTVLSVDKTGAFGEVDDIFVCNWEHTSEAWMDKNGIRIGNIQNREGRRSLLWDGYYPNSQYTRYPQTVIVGQDGSLWAGGVSGAGIHRYIKRTDEPVPDVKRLQLGLSHWNSNYQKDKPLLYLLAGIAGQDQWGGLTFDELAQQTDEKIANYIRVTLTRDDLTDVDMAELIYYLRYEAIKDAVSVYSPAEIPDKPESELLVSHQSLMDLLPGQSLDLGGYECESRAPGVSCKSIFAFSSLVYDLVNHRLLVFGGGHAATNRTDVDSFDLETLTWASLYPSMTCEQINNQDDVDPKGFYRSTGHPLARHTYDQTVVASIGGTPHLMLFSNEGFNGKCKDFAQRPRSVAALPLSGDPIWKYSKEFSLPWGYGFPAEFDPISGKVVCLSSQRSMYFYDPVTEEIIESKDLYPAQVSNSSTLTYFPPLDQMYLIDRGSMDVHEIQINRDDLSATITELVETTGDKPNALRNIAYDDENNILGGVEDSAFYVFDPITNIWSRHPIPNNPGSVYAHAIAFDQVSKTFIFVTDRDSGQRVWAYKFDPDAESIPLPTEPEEPPVAELQILQVVDVQDGWGDEFPDGGRYSRKLSGVTVTDPSLVLAFVAVRDRAESVENESEPGVAVPIRYGNTPMHDIISDPGNDGKSNRGAHCYGLQVEQQTESIRWSLGRVGGVKTETSGRCAGIGCVIPGGFVRDSLVKIESGESINATIQTEPGDLILSFLSSGTNSYTDWPASNGQIIGQNYMNPSVPVRGQLAVHADGNVEWTGVDGEQNLALIVLAISSTAQEPKKPPVEEPPVVEDHPAKVMLADAKSALVDAKTSIDAVIALIDSADAEL